MAESTANVRRAGRVALALVLFLIGAVVLPRPAGRLLAPDASAQVAATPLPTVPDVFASPKPSSSSSEEPEDPDEGDGEDGDGGGSGTGDGGKGDGGSGTKAGDKTRHEDGEGRVRERRGDKQRENASPNRRRRDKERAPGGGVYVGTPQIPGSFNTDKLVAIAANLRSLGWSSDKVLKEAYAPFIIGGHAAWIDTWGSPRYGPAPGQVRTHQGQDVFCDYGAPVLASEMGMIEFDEGGLGGKIARLYRGDGSYWYYAHLSDWAEDLSSGDRVRPGDVIGYCGTSGNAQTTPPHVHFGWYQANGKAKNPMRTLVSWLRRAEARARVEVAEVTHYKIKQIFTFRTSRLFGDAFAPDLSQIQVAGGSLWVTGSYQGRGALGLAEAALQAALSAESFASGPVRARKIATKQARSASDLYGSQVDEVVNPTRVGVEGGD